MAPRGRPPKLSEQRVVEGGTKSRGVVSHRKTAQPVVLAPRVTAFDRPVPPDNLPPEALEFWDVAIEALIDLNAAQMIDVPALEMLCTHYWMAKGARKVLYEQGQFAHGSTGQITEHPAMKIFERQSALFLRYAEQFGLTTLARTRLGLMDVARRSLEDDLSVRTLGRNPRKTNRTEN